MGKEEDIGLEDIFINFKHAVGRTDSSNCVTLRETVVETALAIGGNRAWAIQEVEPFFHLENLAEAFVDAVTDKFYFLQVGLGRPGIADIGEMGHAPPPGLLCRFDIGLVLAYQTAGVGVTYVTQPRPWKPATAVPYARNRISIYVRAEPDILGMRDVRHTLRINFTYIPVTDRLYREINERWALD